MKIDSSFNKLVHFDQNCNFNLRNFSRGFVLWHEISRHMFVERTFQILPATKVLFLSLLHKYYFFQYSFHSWDFKESYYQGKGRKLSKSVICLKHANSEASKTELNKPPSPIMQETLEQFNWYLSSVFK